MLVTYQSAGFAFRLSTPLNIARKVDAADRYLPMVSDFRLRNDKDPPLAAKRYCVHGKLVNASILVVLDQEKEVIVQIVFQNESEAASGVGGTE